ncbi:MAG: YdcF family protein [Candidatus Micrarchaeota archaeon]|nr:YdcF family protein [Candidatus Micrarchaeota archaeon]
MDIREAGKDVIVVLGRELNRDWSLPDDSKRCVEKLAELYKANPQALVILSGYKSFKIMGIPERTEAQAMKEYAISLGIPGDRILKEERSMDTTGNAYFVDDMISGMRNIGELTVVSIDYHTERTRFIFNKMFRGRVPLHFKKAVSGLPEEEMRRMHRSEQETLELLELLFTGTRDGDRIRMRHMIELTHPLYAKDLETVPNIVWSATRMKGYPKEFFVSLREANLEKTKRKA